MKKYIFIDEPEKYSHPSLLHRTAKMIEELSKSKDVYIATHSPKLISMKDIGIDSIYVLNDTSYEEKELPFKEIIDETVNQLDINQIDKKSKEYYQKVSLQKIIKNLHYHDFLYALFSKKIYLVEGIIDEVFLKKYWQYKNIFFEDYAIFVTYGKFALPIFAGLFKKIGIDVQIFFDIDDEKIDKHKQVNEILRTYNNISFNPNIEKYLTFEGKKNDIKKFIDFIDIFDMSSLIIWLF